MTDSVGFFRRNGYLVIPAALTGTEVDQLNRAIDRDRQLHPQMWMKRDEGGRSQAVNLLLSCPEFDASIRQPSVFPLVESLMGEEVSFEEHSVMIREPIDGEPPNPAWHRDTPHLPGHPLAMRHLSVVYYLTDVDEGSHCFAIVPEDVEEKTKMPAARDGSGAIALYGAAGTAILFNAGSCHAGMLRRTVRPRRTIHIYYGHRSQPALSNHTISPRRLVDAEDHATRKLFARPNAITELVRASA
jgi:hypothetical protein